MSTSEPTSPLSTSSYEIVSDDGHDVSGQNAHVTGAPIGPNALNGHAGTFMGVVDDTDSGDEPDPINVSGAVDNHPSSPHSTSNGDEEDDASDSGSDWEHIVVQQGGPIDGHIIPPSHPASVAQQPSPTVPATGADVGSASVPSTSLGQGLETAAQSPPPPPPHGGLQLEVVQLPASAYTSAPLSPSVGFVSPIDDRDLSEGESEDEDEDRAPALLPPNDSPLAITQALSDGHNLAVLEMTVPLDALSTSPSQSSLQTFHSFRSDPSDQPSAVREDPSSPLQQSPSPGHAPEDIALHDPTAGSAPSPSSSAPTSGGPMAEDASTAGPSAAVEVPASSSGPQVVFRARALPNPEKPKKKRKTRAQRRQAREQRALKRQAKANNQAQGLAQAKSAPKPKTEAQKAAQEAKRKRKAEKKARKKQAKAAAAAAAAAGQGVAPAIPSKSAKKKAKRAKAEAAAQSVQQSANPWTMSSAIPQPQALPFPINEESGDVDEEEILRGVYPKAVQYMNNYIANPHENVNPAERLLTAQALLIELGVVTTPYTDLPCTMASARKHLAAHVHINIVDYLEVREGGLTALQGVLRTSKAQLKKELRKEKKKGNEGKKVTPEMAKNLGLRDLLISTC
ncbi:hypothetical protein DL93DRAFT_2085199 [Clavulina sp. PMI_390]|nr:hypothetical protein DL93DRAFT_2085199 [Clavulina sp. PMI_390]